MSRWNRQLIIALAVSIGVSGVAHAELQQSTNFSMNESQLGAGGDFTSSSNNFTNVPHTDDSGSTLGDNAVGNSSSTNFQTNSGFNTTAQPTLTFTVNTSNVSLGTLTSSAKSTAVGTFSAINYTSYGYVVTIAGTAPTNSGHALTALTTDTASSAGTEQFGVNTVRNTTAGVGANPVQTPGGPPTFGYGVAGDGVTGTFGTTRPYTISDRWRFVPGETVASAPKSSGETDYTMTFMANIAGSTPGGIYSGNISLICTGTY